MKRSEIRDLTLKVRNVAKAFIILLSPSRQKKSKEIILSLRNFPPDCHPGYKLKRSCSYARSPNTPMRENVFLGIKFIMPVLLFKLRDAPADEVEDVRALLRAKEIEFYETQAGMWGIGAAAIWLHDESRRDEARSLLDAYQTERAARVRSEYEALRRDGKLQSLWDRLRARPLAALIGLIFILFILYLSLAPFLNMGEWL
jgi:hypothetical protein